MALRGLVEHLQGCAAGAEQAAGRFQRLTQPILLDATRIDGLDGLHKEIMLQYCFSNAAFTSLILHTRKSGDRSTT
jgi:hypothetical protein